MFEWLSFYLSFLGYTYIIYYNEGIVIKKKRFKCKNELICEKVMWEYKKIFEYKVSNVFSNYGKLMTLLFNYYNKCSNKIWSI